MAAIFFESLTSNLIALLVIITITVYFYVKYTFGYWKRYGIKSFPSSFPFGNFSDSFLQKSSFSDVVETLYRQTTEPYIGTFIALKPTLMIRDPELIRNVLIKDFQYFIDRGVYIDEQYDPLSGHLFSMTGDKWKNLRTKLSPVFTSGKLKAMFSTLIDCGVPLKDYLDRAAKNNEDVEMREIAARYATNVIASVAFGVDINTIDNPDHPFRAAGRKAFDLNIKNGIRMISFIVYPKLIKLLRIGFVDKDVESFIMNLVKKNVEYREANDVIRKDFFQLLIQLRNTGKIDADGNWEVQSKSNALKTLTMNEMAAQVWVFYAAGFETSSSVMSFCAYELAKHQDIQRKVQKEIDDITKKNDGQITYTSIGDMKYLEACIDETLRKYPSLPLLNRQCVKDYKIPGSDHIIAKGTDILIPIYSLQRDSKYYPNPLKFQPERFMADKTENKSFIEQPYLPFGDGPRNCIGMRLGKLQTKVGLITMLQKFNFVLSKTTDDELTLSPKTFLMAPVGGIHLKFVRRV